MEVLDILKCCKVIARRSITCMKLQIHFVALIYVQFEASNKVLHSVLYSLQTCESYVVKCLRGLRVRDCAILSRQCIHP